MQLSAMPVAAICLEGCSFDDLDDLDDFHNLCRNQSVRRL